MPYENVYAFDEDNSELGVDNSDRKRNEDVGLIRRPLRVKWFLTAMSGIAVALQCSLMLFAEVQIGGMKKDVRDTLWRKGFYFLSAVAVLIYGVGASLASAMIIVYISPRAASSGIPDTKAFLNGNHIPQLLSFRTWAGRTACLILVNTAGLFAGSEGPLLAHLGAIVASSIARGRYMICGKRRRLPWKLGGHRAQCEFVSIGTAMGVSGGFGAPVGGMLFSLEEASSFWPSELTWRTFFGCAIASIFTKVMKSIVKGTMGAFIEFPDLHVSYQPWELFPFMGIAVATGVLSGLWCRLVRAVMLLRKRCITTKGKNLQRVRMCEVVVLAAIVVMGCNLAPVAFGCTSLCPFSSCDEDAEDVDAVGHVIGKLGRGHCDEGNYSDLAALIAQPRQWAIQALFTKSFAGGARFSEGALVAAFLLIYFGTLACTGMAMPLGLFVPHIMSGACLGRIFGQVVYAVTGDLHVHPGVYAAVGAAGQLAGICRMTLSLTLIMVEVTGSMRLMVPLMLCIMVSRTIADRFDKSAFDVAIALNQQIRFLDPDEWRWDGEDIIAFDICTRDVTTFRGVEPRSRILEVLDTTAYKMFPIIEGGKLRIVGVIERSKLLKAAGQESESEMVDLMVHADLSPEVKDWQTPVTRVLTHFRLMGLQYLCIIDTKHRLFGIVTRTDLSKVCTAAGRQKLQQNMASIQAKMAEQNVTRRDSNASLLAVPRPSSCAIRRSLGSVASSKESEGSSGKSSPLDGTSSYSLRRRTSHRSTSRSSIASGSVTGGPGGRFESPFLTPRSPRVSERSASVSGGDIKEVSICAAARAALAAAGDADLVKECRIDDAISSCAEDSGLGITNRQDGGQKSDELFQNSFNPVQSSQGLETSSPSDQLLTEASKAEKRTERPKPRPPTLEGLGQESTPRQSAFVTDWDFGLGGDEGERNVEEAVPLPKVSRTSVPKASSTGFANEEPKKAALLGALEIGLSSQDEVLEAVPQQDVPRTPTPKASSTGLANESPKKAALLCALEVCLSSQEEEEEEAAPQQHVPRTPIPKASPTGFANAKKAASLAAPEIGLSSQDEVDNAAGPLPPPRRSTPASTQAAGAKIVPKLALSDALDVAISRSVEAMHDDAEGGEFDRRPHSQSDGHSVSPLLSIIQKVEERGEKTHVELSEKGLENGGDTETAHEMQATANGEEQKQREENAAAKAAMEARVHAEEAKEVEVAKAEDTERN
eukprot:TRINITY_DN6337_c0_g1_i2.p1 TRINITY_DN6337_c0_g1~~TRINITY_DN6337_c0_g1_i2.p1  ORF type:complete len:1358 (+),score=258.29 TRINITY_DN6337_c0_g1_i2:425-4075(+)